MSETTYRRNQNRFSIEFFPNYVLFPHPIYRATSILLYGRSQFGNLGLLKRRAILGPPAVSIRFGQHLRNKLSTLSLERTQSAVYHPP